VPLSPLDVEIGRARLQAAVDEAAAVLVRTAFSHIVRDAKDFACALLSPDADTVAQSRQSIPAFLGTMAHTAHALLEEFPADQLWPGEVVATNDPWLGSGHLSDITLMQPIYASGGLVGFAVVVAHLPDIGGRVGFAMDATEVFEEGLRIPPLKLVHDGAVDPVLAALLVANVRLPEQVLGDIDAALNALAVICTSVTRFCETGSPQLFQEITGELERRSEAFMRQAIGRVPDGTYTATLDLEGVGDQPIRLGAAVRVAGDEIEVDFAGTSGQVLAGINSPFAYSRAYVMYALKCLLAPTVPLNDGLFRPISVVAPSGTVVASNFPAAADARNVVGHAIPTLVINALTSVIPDDCIAECASPRPIIYVTGRKAASEGFFAVPILLMGGLGARAAKDGPSCIAFPSNTQAVSIEMIEAGSPLEFEHSELVVDSGGAGRSRGGLGRELRIRALRDGMRVAVVAQRVRFAPLGALEGAPGGLTCIEVNGERIELMGDVIQLDRDDVLMVRSSGGGGYGAAAQRDAALLAADVLDEYVSPAAAESAYAVPAQREVRP
jgi:N-methylhydantoinase B